MMGWSNGAGMAMIYAMNRPQLAAAAVYSAPNPIDALSDPCGQTPVTGAPRNDTELQVFNPGVPIVHVINHCDIQSGCPTGLALDNTLRVTAAAAPRLQIIDGLQMPVDRCMALCGTNPRDKDYTDLSSGIPAAVSADGTLLHLRWPTDSTADFFSFLREHPNTAQRRAN